MGKTATAEKQISEDEVVSYLKTHPDFLMKHPDLVMALTPPTVKHGKGVVDFQNFMLDRLKHNFEWLKSQQRELIQNSRLNTENLNRIHAAILILLEANDFEDFIQIITSDFALLLNVDIATLVLESSDLTPPYGHQSGIRIVPEGVIEHWLGGQDVLLNNNIYGLEEIFGPAADLVRSQALIRLDVSVHTPVGLLAFGSRDPDFFDETQSTELIEFLAQAVGRCIRSWLELRE